jgi:hypothetical protein
MDSINILTKYLAVLSKVYTLTAQNKIKWEQTASPDDFTAKLGEAYLISMSLEELPYNKTDYIFSIFDDKGQMLGVVSSIDHGKMEIAINDHDAGILETLMGTNMKTLITADVLRDLYNRARVKALGIEKKIGDLSNLLDDLEKGSF